MTAATVDSAKKKRPGSSARSLRNEGATRLLIYGMNYFPELAGVGKYTGEMAEFFSREGVDVTVVTTPPHYPGWVVQGSFKNRYSYCTTNGVKIIRTPIVLPRKMRGIWRLVAPISFAVASAPIIFWQILRQRPHTVFCIEPTLLAAPIAQLAARLVGAKTVLHVQDLEVDAAFAVGHLRSKKWLQSVGYAFERATLKRFSMVVTISTRMSEKLEEKGVLPERLFIVRNWVDLAHIYPMNSASLYRTELGYNDNHFIALYSGNIGAKQGLNLVLEAARILKDDRNICFVIAGEGPEKEDLKRAAGDLPNIRFLPFQPYSRLNEFLNMASLHLLPQERGAADLVLPSKLGGMLASGKPILITADVGTELANFVVDAAYVVSPGDASALATAIDEISKRDYRDEPLARRAALAQTLSKDEAVKLLLSLVKHSARTEDLEQFPV